MKFQMENCHKLAVNHLKYVHFAFQAIIKTPRICQLLMYCVIHHIKKNLAKSREETENWSQFWLVNQNSKIVKKNEVLTFTLI